MGKKGGRNLTSEFLQSKAFKRALQQWKNGLPIEGTTDLSMVMRMIKVLYRNQTSIFDELEQQSKTDKMIVGLLKNFPIEKKREIEQNVIRKTKCRSTCIDCGREYDDFILDCKYCNGIVKPYE